jgi:hypothetical protein
MVKINHTPEVMAVQCKRLKTQSYINPEALEKKFRKYIEKYPNTLNFNTDEF